MRISMLIDEDLRGHDNPGLISQIENDEEMRATWERYQLIGQVLREPQGMFADTDFAKRISMAVAEEPVILVPKLRSKMAQTIRSKSGALALAAVLSGVAIMLGSKVVDQADPWANSSIAATDRSELHDAAVTADNSDARFNDYLLMHNETAYMAGSAGMLPHVRLVSAGSYR